MCTRNGAQFVEEQVRSILNQSLEPNELVVSDDASTDETVRIVRETVQNSNSRIALRVMENKQPLGVTKNFEQALLACAGDLLVLCDQDDIWQENRIAVAAAEFAARPELDLLHSNARLVDAGGAPIGANLFGALGISRWEKERVRSGAAMEALVKRNLATGATTMIRKRLLEVAALFPGSWVHDEWLAIIAAATGKVDLIEEPLLDYRQHGGNEIGASRITFAGKLAKLREPRTRRNERLAANAASLVDRLEMLGARVPAAALELARGKLAHEQVRLGLPAHRWRRIAPVLREARTGGYSRFGRGAQDVLRDLVQPVDDPPPG
jgi:glycosyltransferase involved in cell wall biosynthesis